MKNSKIKILVLGFILSPIALFGMEEQWLELEAQNFDACVFFEGKPQFVRQTDADFKELENMIIQLPADVFVDSQSGDQELNKSFFDAVKTRNIDLVKEFLSKGANVNFQDNDGNCALLETIIKGHDAGGDEDDVAFKKLELTKILLLHGANPLQKNKNGWSPLSLAIMYKKTPKQFALLLNAIKSRSDDQLLFELYELLEKLMHGGAGTVDDQTVLDNLKLLLYVFRDFTPKGFCESERILVEYCQGSSRYKNAKLPLYFIGGPLAFDAKERCIGKIKRIIATWSLELCAQFKSLEKYFNLQPKNNDEYLKDPVKYKKTHEDEFDPVQQFPQDFEKCRQIEQELQLEYLQKKLGNTNKYLNGRELCSITEGFWN